MEPISDDRAQLQYCRSKENIISSVLEGINIHEWPKASTGIDFYYWVQCKNYWKARKNEKLKDSSLTRRNLIAKRENSLI